VDECQPLPGARPIRQSPAATSVRPSAVVSVRPMAFCTRAKAVVLMVKDTAARVVSQPQGRAA